MEVAGDDKGLTNATGIAWRELSASERAELGLDRQAMADTLERYLASDAGRAQIMAALELAARSQARLHKARQVDPEVLRRPRVPSRMARDGGARC